MSKKFLYKAFISYSHADKEWGDWLHEKLETFAVPKEIVGIKGVKSKYYKYIPPDLVPIFRDRNELPTSSELGQEINLALKLSSHLVVICSPNSAKSHWVNQEIIQFKRLGKADKIVCFIVEGEPNATDMKHTTQQECFPEAIRYKLHPNGNLSSIKAEPIAADARTGKDGKENALLKIVAGLLGVGFDHVKQRSSIRRKKQFIIYSGICCVSIVLVFLIAFLGRYIGYQDAHQQGENQFYAETAAKAKEQQQNIKKELQDLKRNFEAKDENLLIQAKIANRAKTEARKVNLLLSEQKKAVSAALDMADSAKAEARKVNLLLSEQKKAVSEAFDMALQEEYFSKTTLIDLKIKNGEFESAKDLLWSTKPQFRHWEWGRLLNEIDSSLFDIPTKKEIAKVKFSFDGKYIVALQWGGLIKIFDSNNGNLVKSFSLHKSVITSLTCTKLNGYFASADKGGNVYIWECPSGKVVLRLDENNSEKAEVRALSFSIDGNYIAVGRADQKIEIWSIKRGLLDRVIKTNKNEVYSLGYLTKNELIAGHIGRINTWNPNNGEMMRSLKIPIKINSSDPKSNLIKEIKVSKGKKIALIQNTKVFTVDFETFKVSSTFSGHKSGVRSIAFSVDGKTLATSGQDKVIYLWNFAEGTEHKLNGHSLPVNSVDFHPDGKRLLSGSEDRKLLVWDLLNSSNDQAFGQAKDNNWVDLSVSKTNSLNAGNGVSIFDFNKNKIIKTFGKNKEAFAKKAFFCNSDTQLIVLYENGLLKIIDLASGNDLKHRQVAEKIRDFYINGNRSMIISIDHDNYATLLDLATHEIILLKQLPFEPNFIKGNADMISPNSDIFAVMYGESFLTFFDLFKFDQKRTISFGPSKLNPIKDARFAFSPSEDSYIITHSKGEKVAFSYEISKDGSPTSNFNYKLEGHSGEITSINFSRTGKRIITTSKDQTIKIWEGKTGRELLSLPAGSCNFAKFSDDDMWIVACYNWQGKIFKALNFDLTREKYKANRVSNYNDWIRENTKM